MESEKYAGSDGTAIKFLRNGGEIIVKSLRKLFNIGMKKGSSSSSGKYHA